MKSKFSIVKSVVVSAAFVAGVSSTALADDSSVNPYGTSPAVDNAPSAWRQSHANGLAFSQFAAMGSEAIAARPSSDQEKPTALASTNNAADMPSASREPIATRIARFFHITPANQATRAN